MKYALLRLLLALIPLIPLSFFLFLNGTETHISQKQNLTKPNHCSFFLALSPRFSHQEWGQDSKFQSFLIGQKNWKEQISKAEPSLNVLFSLALPVYQTKDGHWLISEKSFFISKDSGRVEISHWDYKKIQGHFFETHKDQVLSLQEVLKSFPEASLFLKIESKQDEKILKSLDFLKNRQSSVMIASSENNILGKIKKSYPSVLVLHSFQKMIHLNLLLPFGLDSFVKLLGDGILIPDSFSISDKVFLYMKSQNKSFIIESDDPFKKIPKALAKKSQGLVSSNLASIRNFIIHKKPCFLKNSAFK